MSAYIWVDENGSWWRWTKPAGSAWIKAVGNETPVTGLCFLPRLVILKLDYILESPAAHINEIRISGVEPKQAWGFFKSSALTFLLEFKAYIPVYFPSPLDSLSSTYPRLSWASLQTWTPSRVPNPNDGASQPVPKVRLIRVLLDPSLPIASSCWGLNVSTCLVLTTIYHPVQAPSISHLDHCNSFLRVYTYPFWFPSNSF